MERATEHHAVASWVWRASFHACILLGLWGGEGRPNWRELQEASRAPPIAHVVGRSTGTSSALGFSMYVFC